MDEALKKEISDLVSGAIQAAIAPVVSQVGQVAEAAKKIGEIEGNVKVLSETMAGQKIPTIEQLQAQIDKGFADRETAAAEKAKAGEATAALKAKRDAFAAEKLKGVLPSYHAALGNDESKWPEQEKSIREKFAADMKAAGIKVPDLGGSAGGSSPAAAVDMSNLSGQKLIELGLKTSRPVGMQGADAARAKDAAAK